jgi:hypothetical protein
LRETLLRRKPNSIVQVIENLFILNFWNQFWNFILVTLCDKVCLKNVFCAMQFYDLKFCNLLYGIIFRTVIFCVKLFYDLKLIALYKSWKIDWFIIFECPLKIFEINFEILFWQPYVINFCLKNTHVMQFNDLKICNQW